MYSRIRATKTTSPLLTRNFNWLKSVSERKQIGIPRTLTVVGGSPQAAVGTNTDHTRIKSQTCGEGDNPARADFVGKPFKLNLEYDVWCHRELTLRERSKGN